MTCGKAFFVSGSIEKVYGYISCGMAADNSDGSYLTMLSRPGLMFGIINIVGEYQQSNKTSETFSLK